MNWFAMSMWYPWARQVSPAGLYTMMSGASVAAFLLDIRIHWELMLVRLSIWAWASTAKARIRARVMA